MHLNSTPLSPNTIKLAAKIILQGYNSLVFSRINGKGNFGGVCLRPAAKGIYDRVEI